jgi:hypothetical protein
MLIRQLWQIKTVVFLHRCLIHAGLLLMAQKTEKISKYLESLEIKKIAYDGLYLKAVTFYPKKVSHRFLVTTKLFIG